MNKNKNYEQQLNASLENARLKRHSGLNEFSGVYGIDNIKENSEMIAELLEAPSLKRVTNELKSYDGVINLITRNEYPPLIEFLIRNAFSGTDVYNMGTNAKISDDYSVNARDFFYEGRNRVEKFEKGKEKMKDLLFGSKKLMTMEWFQNSKIDDGFLNIKIPPPPGWQEENPGKVYAIELMNQYKLEMDSIKESSTYKSLSKLNKKISEDLAKRARMKKDPSLEDSIMDDQKLEQLKEEFRSKRDMVVSAINTVKSREIYEPLVRRDEHSGSPLRENNGFMNWDSSSTFKSLYDNLKNNLQQIIVKGRQQNVPLEIRKQNINILLEEATDGLEKFSNDLDSFYSEDDSLNNKAKNLKSFIGSERGSIRKRLDSNRTELINLMEDFIKSCSSQEQTIIFSNMDQSPFVEMTSDGITFAANEVLGDFIDKSQSQKEIQKNEKGKKLILMVSKQPLNNLKHAKVIDMDEYRTSEKEAEIILRHVIDPFVKSSARAYKNKMAIELENKDRKSISKKGNN
jgi:hypothetical protein